MLELITLGRALGRVEAVALEAPSVGVLAQLGAHGIALVRQAEPSSGGEVVTGDALHLTPVVAEVLAAAARASHADAVLLTSSFPNKEAAARLAFLTGPASSSTRPRCTTTAPTSWPTSASSRARGTCAARSSPTRRC